MKKAVFLDRDGVLNKTIFRKGKARAPYTLEEFELFDGVKEGLDLLKSRNFTLIVVTNQPDVERGWVSREAVDVVNAKVKELLPVDDIKACFHTEKDNCTCRKPKPGMILDAASEWDIDIQQSYMVGDRDSDVQAGVNAGCKTILVGPGDDSIPVKPDFKAASLLEAAKYIVQSSS